MDKIFWNLERCKWGISSVTLLGWTSIWRGTAWHSRLVLVYCCLEVVPSSPSTWHEQPSNLLPKAAHALGDNSEVCFCEASPVCPTGFIHRKKAKMIKLPVGEGDTTAKRSVSRGGHGSGTFLNMHVHTSSHSLFPEATVLYAVCFILLPTTVSSILGPPDFFATKALLLHLNSAQNLTKKLLIWHIPKIAHLLLMLFDSK